MISQEKSSCGARPKVTVAEIPRIEIFLCKRLDALVDVGLKGFSGIDLVASDTNVHVLRSFHFPDRAVVRAGLDLNRDR